MEIGLGWGCALNLFAAYKLSHFKNGIHQGRRKGPVRRWRCKQPSSISSEVMCMKSRQPVEEIWKPKVRTDREGHFCCPHLSLLYVVGVLSHVWFFVTPWSVHTRLLCPWDFPGWSGLLFPSPGNLPNPGIELMYFASAGGFFTIAPPGKPVPTCLYKTSFFARNPFNSQHKWHLLWMPPLQTLSAGIFTQLDWWSRAPCGHDLDLSILLKATCCLWSP